VKSDFIPSSRISGPRLRSHGCLLYTHSVHTTDAHLIYRPSALLRALSPNRPNAFKHEPPSSSLTALNVISRSRRYRAPGLGVEEEAEKDAGYGFLSFITHRLTGPKVLHGDILYYIKTAFFPTPLVLRSLLETSYRCHKPLYPPPVDRKTYILTPTRRLFI